MKELVHDKQTAGYYNVNWNGIDNTGKKVSSGVYFYHIRTDKKSLRKKMLLLK